MKIIASILSLLFFSLVSLLAQPLCDMKMYTVEDGLSQSAITDILQDHNGLIWISTWNGLIRFDGYMFKQFKSYPGDGCTMKNTRINKIDENSSGDIWCITQDNRAYLFDVKTEAFIDVLLPIEAKIRQTNVVERCYPLKKGITWIICANAYCYRIEDASCKTEKGIAFFGSYEKKVKGDYIYQVCQDSDEDEWVFTDKGVTIIGKKQLNNDFPFQYFVEMNLTIWLASKNGRLATYNASTSNVVFVDLPASVNQILNLVKLRDNVLAICTNDGLLLLNTKDGSLRQINVQVASTASNDVHWVYEDRFQDLWIINPDPGVLHVIRESGKVIRHQSPDNQTIKHSQANRTLITEDRQGFLWVIPRGGNFTFFDRTRQQLRYYSTDQKDDRGILSPSIRTFFIDSQGNLWFGTNRSFGKLSFSGRRFESIPNSKDEHEIRSFLLDRNNILWAASNSGKIRLLDTGNKCIGYIARDGNLCKQECLFERNVYCMLEDHQGNIWLGTKLNGLFLLQKRKSGSYSFTIRHFRHDPTDENSLSHDDIYALYQDSKNRIWVGTHGGGLNLVEQRDNGVIRFIHSENRMKNYPSLHASKVRHIAEVDNDVLMIGTTDGLISFSTSFVRPEEIRFYRNTRKADDNKSLSNNDVSFLFLDSRKQLYLVTQGGGLNRIVSDNLLSESIEFKVYNELNGLASDLTLSMIEDVSGHLWVISKHAISQFDPEKGTFDNFGRFAFKQTYFFSEAAVSLNADSNIVVGTDKGILEYDPLQLKKSDFVPPILFTGLKIQGNPRSISIDGWEQLTLKPSQRNITIEFAALDYLGTSEIRYAYKLEGLDDEWHYDENNRSASYINLPDGEYRFLVKSTNSDGVWVDNVHILPINVVPRFSETVWAFALYVLLCLALALIVVYVLFTIYRLRHEVNVEQQLSDVKLKFFTDVSHELRTPLTLISSPISEVLENELLSPTAKEHLTIVQSNTNRMLRLVNQILDFRKIQNKKMKVLVEEIEVISFISGIMDNFHSIAQEKAMQFQLESDCDVLYLWIDTDKFDKIIFNLLSNAFKYTPSGKSITVRIVSHSDKVIISTIDEGIGIPEKNIQSLFQRFESLVSQNVLQHSSGIGLSLVKELVGLHHATIEVFSQSEIGSEFKITFLKGDAHFRKDGQAEFRTSVNETYKKKPVEFYHAQEDEADIPAKQSVSSKNKKSILLVEDNTELLRFLRTILLPEYRIFEACNGLEGLGKAIIQLPDFIISDVMMPEMDGLDMVKAIKENKDTCHIPIVLLSAKASLDDRINGLENGVDDYITKPFSATYLKARIRSLINQRKHMQELFFSSLSINKPARTELFPSQPQITPHDEVFMEKVMHFMEENIGNPSLTVDDLANELTISRTVFYRKIKTLLGVAPVDFIKDIRVKRAVQLIDTGEFSFSEITYMCGFNDPNYFSKVFKNHTGVSPTNYKKMKKGGIESFQA